MGVKNLWDILESCKKTLPLHHLQNKRVCIDLSCWIIQLETVTKSHCSPKDKVYLKGLFHRIRALIALNCSLIFVSDGSIPAIKLSTYRRRLNGSKEVLVDAENSEKLSSLKRNKGSEFSCMIKEAKALGTALGIPCLDGIEEAEAQCALLNSESLCDGCFTSDSDAFLFGARTVYRDICLGEGGYVVCYEMDDIERKLGFGRNSLIALALLNGSDYTQGVRGIGPESACQIVNSIGDSAVLQRFLSEGYSFTKIKKSIKNNPRSTCTGKENIAPVEMDCNGGKHNLPTDKQFLHQVIDAYLKPKCHSAKSIAVNRVLAVYPFSRTQLHQICSQYFDWSPEKTDEYILPKIAERELRRYANLRSTSSGLGVHLPFDEIPVKCPVSDIVKPRKAQGRDYFEVSWGNIDGLKTSAVPADLVESACPEKILEFQERKAQKQKPSRRPRQKKVNNNVEMKEVDEKLNDLLLDIEQESNAPIRAAIVKSLTPDNAMSSVAQLKLFGHSNPITEKSSPMDIEASNSISQHLPGKEIIDLTSPSPLPLRARCMLRFEKPRPIELIELSESDNDMSPQQSRNSLELRMFISNVSKEL